MANLNSFQFRQSEFNDLKDEQLHLNEVAQTPSPSTKPSSDLKKGRGLESHFPLPEFQDDSLDTVPHVVDATMFWSATGGGVKRYLQVKHDWLTQSAGWKHTIVAPGSRVEHANFQQIGTNDLNWVNCGGMPLPLSGGYRIPLRRNQAKNRIVAQSPDLIEVGDPYRLAWAALDAGQQLGVPTVAFCHSNLAAMAARVLGGVLGGVVGSGRSSEWASELAAKYLKRTYAGFDLVLAPSLHMVNVLREMGVAHVCRQPLGVNSQTFHPRMRDPEWRRELGLPDSARLLLYVGRFAPEKNLSVLADAVAKLGPEYWLIALGAGPTPPLGAQVKVLNYQSSENDVARAMASADAFVHAGDQETFGLSVLEAMASGTPVIVRNKAGLGELISRGNGNAVDTDNPNDWAEVITAVFTESDATRHFRLASARRIAEDYDWRRVMPRLQAHYRGLIGAASNVYSKSQEENYRMECNDLVLDKSRWNNSITMQNNS